MHRHVDLPAEQRLVDLLDEPAFVAARPAVAGGLDPHGLDLRSRPGAAQRVRHEPRLRQRQRAATRADAERSRGDLARGYAGRRRRSSSDVTSPDDSASAGSSSSHRAPLGSSPNSSRTA